MPAAVLVETTAAPAGAAALAAAVSSSPSSCSAMFWPLRGAVFPLTVSPSIRTNCIAVLPGALWPVSLTFPTISKSNEAPMRHRVRR